MAYITLDFGSSNSGALLNISNNADYNANELTYVHCQDGNSEFTKQPTVFWIKRSLLDKEVICESDINIFSCVFFEKHYLENANFIWCQSQIAESLPIISQSDEWERIQHPKMELYKSDNPTGIHIKSSSGKLFPLNKVLALFFMVIKKECLHKISIDGYILDEINWGITVPGMAVWNQEAVSVMKNIGISVFGEKLTLWSEPECALVGLNLAGGSKVGFVDDRYSLVIDLGGGTTDICVMHETQCPDGTECFDEVKASINDKDSTTSIQAGGNDIDRKFKSFFCEYLAEGIELDDTPICLLSDFLKEDPKGAKKFDEELHKLLYSSDDWMDEEISDFYPGRLYLQWLTVRCPEAASKNTHGAFGLNTKRLREYVFDPVYNKILASIEDNLDSLKSLDIKLDVVYLSGGLSLDKQLKEKIESLVVRYFSCAKILHRRNLAVGAVQRGGNHIATHKEEGLIRRMARKTFYTQFYQKNNGDIDSLRESLKKRFKKNHLERFGIKMEESDIEKIIDKQWEKISYDSDSNSVPYLIPLCMRWAPANQAQTFDLLPYDPENQTSVAIKIYSSEKNFMLFNNENVQEEETFEFDFGYHWEKAKLVFDPNLNVVEGNTKFYILDKSEKKIHEFEIKNVTKRGI